VSALPPTAPAIAGMTAYHVPRHPAPLDLLLDGIGGLPAPSDLFDRLRDADPDRLVRGYPDARPFAATLAAIHGLPAERVLVTAGGDDALDRACRAYLAPGRSIVLPTPTFEMIARYATWAGATVHEVPWPGGPWPVDAVLAAVRPDTTVVAVVSPNNPTGQVIDADTLRRLSAALPGVLLLVDLAYVEFADEDLTAVVAELPNAVAFRTLSKAWGLAGLRVGYAVGPRQAIDALRVAGNPYAVSGPSLHLAERRLTSDGEASAAYIAQVRADRDALTDALRALGLDAQRSQANFVFARTPRAAWVQDGLAGLGIGVRGWPGHRTLGDALRINVPGEPVATARLHAGLRAVLAPEAILFDVDGVLVDVSGSYREAIRVTAASFGVPVTADDIARAKARGHANNDWLLTAALLAERGVTVSLDEVTARFERAYQGHDGAPGLKSTERARIDRATLERLRARYTLALVTGRPYRDAMELLEREGWRDLFDAAVVMGETAAKPDPAPVRAAMERLGVRHAWMLGDTVDDIRAARAAGVVPIGVHAPDPAAPLDVDLARATDLLLRAGAARVLSTPLHLEALLP
jgi:histidinol-phosphate aminotransferase